MDTATDEPDVSASCHQPLLSRLYFFPAACGKGKVSQGAALGTPAPRSACHAAKIDCAIFAKYC